MFKSPKLKVHEPARYRIHVQGAIDEGWADYLGDTIMHMGAETGEYPVTKMTGQFHDQSALLGAISRLVDLGLPLLMVEYIPGQTSETFEERED